MSVDLIHEEKLSRERKLFFFLFRSFFFCFWRTSPALSIFTFSQGFKRQSLVSFEEFLVSLISTQLFCYYLKFFLFFLTSALRRRRQTKRKSFGLSLRLFFFVSFACSLCDQNTYKTLMSTDVLGRLPINIDIN